MKRGTLIVGGTKERRSEMALSLPFIGYLYVVECDGMKIDRRMLSNDTVFILHGSTEDDLFLAASMLVDGILLSYDTVVHPMICMCIDKGEVEQFLVSRSLNRSFNIIDLDYDV